MGTTKKLTTQLAGYKNPEGMKKDPTYPIFEAGVEHGKTETMKQVLTYLEDRYINDDDRPDRNSIEGRALLTLAKETATFLRAL